MDRYHTLSDRLLHFDFNLAAPGPVGKVEGHCSVVVWSQPEETNGVIHSYVIYFVTNEDSTRVRTAATQTYYVIKGVDDIPSGDGIHVKVYKPIIIIHIQLPIMCFLFYVG